MVRETHAYGLPCLEENPFSIRPLEPGESGKLIGREDVFLRLRNFLRFRSARRVMLLGPLGSGRTSLVSCLKTYAGAVATIDHLPAKTPAASLLGMCYRQMIGGEPPVNRTDLVTELVNEMYNFNEKLPMIVIDVPASDLSVLEVALRDAHASLERLNALLVLVCDVKERHQLPAAIVEGFELVRLTPFSTGDVMALVRQRLASVGVMDSDFTMQDATAILDECDGYPASVITILRDAVDSIRMAQSNDGPAFHLDTSARIQPRDEPETLRRLMGERTDEAMPNGEFEQETPAQGLVEPTEEPEKASSEVIDASTPWHERPAFPTSPNATGQEEQQAPPTGFELDMNRLFEEQEQDEPLQPAPFNTPIIDADEVLGGVSAPVTGMFKGLAERNKDANLAKGTPTDESVNTQHELVGSSSKFQYWVDETLLTPPPPVDVPEEESAMMLHDEVGLMDTDTSFPAPPELPSFVPTGSSPAASLPVEMDVLSVLAGLLKTGSGPTPSHHEGLLAYLQGRIREQSGPRESYALNKHVLGSMNANESYVVSVAHERDYSPSDAEVLARLNIKRSRLSQISNRLLKHGILQARQVGRSRKYSLTQAARAQLTAWGAVDGGGQQ